jgi:hypothetical protein
MSPIEDESVIPRRFMKTILKFPVYVEITSDNVDRKLVTTTAIQILFPSFKEFLADASFRQSKVNEFKKAIKASNVTVNLLTERDILHSMEKV